MNNKADPKGNPGWRLVDHTADLRIEVSGTTLDELFANAALALTSQLTVTVFDVFDEALTVSVEGDDYEELLVNWLREILFLNQARGFVLARLGTLELAENRIRAVLEGRRIVPDEEKPSLEIKGVTYHGLSVEKTPRGYAALVIFDI